MRPIILGLSPFIPDPWTLDAKRIFDLTGGNTGNLAFEFAVTQHFTPDARIFPIGTPAELLREHGDIIVLPLANQLGSHTDLETFAQHLERIKLPVIGIGLGAQATSQGEDIALSRGTDRWIRTVAGLSPTSGPNIGCRGQYTVEQLEKLGLKNVAIVTGCPSNFITPGTDFIDRIAAKTKIIPALIAVAAGIQHIPALAPIERDLAEIVTASQGIYIAQHGLDMIQLARSEFAAMAPEVLELTRAYIAPHLSTTAFKHWCRIHARVFTDARQWMDELRRYDFVVGTRFHGAMLAVQAGTPAGCITHDSRVMEMCQTMGIPAQFYKDIGHVTRPKLRELFPFDLSRYLATRRQLATAYYTLLKSGNISPSQRLLAIAQATKSP